MPVPASVTPHSTDITAPNPICAAPTRPDAVPARLGRTLTAAAMAFGWVMPLPSATTAIGRKNSTICGGSSNCTATASAAPAVVTMAPTASIRTTPSRWVSRAAVKVPVLQATEITIMALA